LSDAACSDIIVAVVAVAAVETEEEEEARTVDVVAHGARGHDAGELLPSDEAVAHWPATR
jgi:predicted transcriptional regulator